jgi:3-dehydrosphinganine reductase
MSGFAGKTVVVTGGSSGIGLATAKAFASRGAKIAIVARDEQRLEAAKREVEAARSDATQPVLAVSADVADRERITSAINGISAQLGTPDVLVNAAGIFVPGYFEELDPELFERHLDVDVLGLIWATRAVAPAMVARGSGHIVNIASVAGFIGVFGYTAYNTAKYAVMGFSEALRSELKPLGVSVHVVCPPDVDTPGLAREKSLRPRETDRVCGNIKAIQPTLVAAEILAGVEKNRYYVITGAISKVYFRLKGVLPGVFFAVTDGDVAKARAERLVAGEREAAEEAE